MQWTEEHAARVSADFDCADRVYRKAYYLKHAKQPDDACSKLYHTIAGGEYWRPYDAAEFAPREAVVATAGNAIKAATWSQRVLFEAHAGPTHRRLKALLSQLRAAHKLLAEFEARSRDNEDTAVRASAAAAHFASACVVEAVETSVKAKILHYEDAFHDEFVRYSGDTVALLYECLAFGMTADE